MIYHVQFPGLGLDLTVNRVALAIGGSWLSSVPVFIT